MGFISESGIRIMVESILKALHVEIDAAEIEKAWEQTKAALPALAAEFKDLRADVTRIEGKLNDASNALEQFVDLRDMLPTCETKMDTLTQTLMDYQAKVDTVLVTLKDSIDAATRPKGENN
jgi:hypothetical protein